MVYRTNNGSGADLELETLDKGFSNAKWMLQCPLSNIYCFPIVASDHAPILLETSRMHAYKTHVFHFQNMWLLHPDCNEIVTKA